MNIPNFPKPSDATIDKSGAEPKPATIPTLPLRTMLPGESDPLTENDYVVRKESLSERINRLDKRILWWTIASIVFGGATLLSALFAITLSGISDRVLPRFFSVCMLAGIGLTSLSVWRVIKNGKLCKELSDELDGERTLHDGMLFVKVERLPTDIRRFAPPEGLLEESNGS